MGAEALTYGENMREPGGWWRRKSTPAKIETYTRWSFHFFALAEVAAVGLPLFGAMPGWLSVLLLVLLGGHAGLCALTASRALDWTRGRRDQPLHMLWTLGAVTVAVAVTAIAITEHGPRGEDVDTAAGGIFAVVLIFGAGVIALGLRDRKRIFALVGGFAAGAGVIAFPLGLPGPATLAAMVAVLLGAGFLAFTSVFSVWLLTAVYELDEARETRARLAVAEERLRFGRDLHDVMGRNLAVIALKSELAVQLARRGREEAVNQMTEVQRIAQETQREVRDVVRGYREADLEVELTGARGVLIAAGIACEITGEPGELPAEVQSALGWVVREATTNVLRHGDAKRCTVAVRTEEERVELTVENDGVLRSSGGAGGSGLAGLRERLAAVAGTLEAGPAREGVFRLVAQVPLPATEATS
ncbi:two-component system sensor histidine kinase DesK [Streptomyces sp. SAI-149]|nr:two-component system sensor histidine kinase DesK [Streptomyces sp. SAI-119]MDH6498190.1 two-component system sensor histidine kinase DesK [Streptomyces sp. SAI-149]